MPLRCFCLTSQDTDSIHCNRRLSRKRYKTGPWLLCNVNWKSCSGSFRGSSDDLAWPWKAGLEKSHFRRVLFLTLVPLT